MNLTTRLIARLAAGAAVLAFTQHAYAAAQQPQQQKAKQVNPSKGALKALSELQAAVKSKDAAAIQAKVAAAQAVVTTNEDRYVLAQLQLSAAADRNDAQAAMTAMDAMLATNVLSPTEAAPVYKNLSQLRYSAKQYDQAAAAIQKRLELDPNDVDAIALLAESRNAQGRTADAVAALQRGLQMQAAAGRKPDEAWLKRAVALAYNANLPVSAELARQWVTAYPNPSSWQTAIVTYRQTVRPDADGSLDLMRLMRAAGALTTPMDYLVYLDALNTQSNFIEAQRLIEKSPQLDTSNAALRDMVAQVKAKPSVAPADLAAAARTADTGTALLRIGDRYYGLGDYAKAVELYQQAKAKGADANLVNERVGVALATKGDNAAATAALKAVTGAHAGVAQLWLLFLQTQG